MGNKLLNIRNPWGQLEWNGRWSDKSPLWTDQMQALVKPDLANENDGAFWMCFEDFLQYFKCVNICRVKNWEEIRLKGKFLRVQDKNNNLNEIVLSRWNYSVIYFQAIKFCIDWSEEKNSYVYRSSLRRWEMFWSRRDKTIFRYWNISTKINKWRFEISLDERTIRS